MVLNCILIFNVNSTTTNSYNKKKNAEDAVNL